MNSRLKISQPVTSNQANAHQTSQQRIKPNSSRNSPSDVQRNVQATIDASPRQVAQRKKTLSLYKSGSQPMNNSTIQRVGGNKIGFKWTESGDATIKEGQKLLAEAWEEVRRQQHVTKTGSEKDELERAAYEEIEGRKNQKARDEYRRLNPTAKKVTVDASVPVFKKTVPNLNKEGFTKYYANKLTHDNRNNQKEQLNNTAPFKSLHIILDGKKIKYRKNDTDPYIEIGTLKEGLKAFEKSTTTEVHTQQTVYIKRGINKSYNSTDPKEYILDSRGVMTRRFVYVEKNYYQMMEFFMTNRMDGRFAAHMRAAGDDNPDLYEHRDESVDLVRGNDEPKDDTVKLTVEQMAVAHQKLGSGPQQRGVSLTATPKVNATYVNTGENFRTDRGFRLKIDLAKVPEFILAGGGGPLLVNHYSSGGVIDAPNYDTARVRVLGPRRADQKQSKYPYKESSIHARELLLEYLKPEWITAIEYHDQGNKTGSGVGSTTLAIKTNQTGKDLLKKAKQDFGGDEYEKGFNFGLVRSTNNKTTNPYYTGNKDFQEGFAGARLFVEGWGKGKVEYNRAGHNEDQQGQIRSGLTMPQYIYDQKKKEDEDQFDLFQLGYLQGRSGKALITSCMQLPGHYLQIK